MLPTGTRLGPYEIGPPLGAGGMGEVYRARDERLGRDVAIKVLPEALAATEELRQRFDREARTISKLSHPGICSVFDVGREGSVQFLVMELIEGETLAVRLKKGRMPMDLVLRSGAEIAGALGAAHARAIVHRDLKPANVMLTPSGVKLLDFGLAKVFAPVGVGSLAQTMSRGITVAEDRALLGTIPYMAPEQLEGKEIDARADIFAFGAVLFEMATGTRAFGGASQATVMSAILNYDPPSLSTLRPESPAALAGLVRRCLAKNPEARWSSAHDLELQLREIAEFSMTLAAAASTPRVRRRMAWLPWALTTVAVLLAATLLLRAPSRREGSADSIRFQMAPPPGQAFYFAFEGSTLAVSPDGSQVAVITADLNEVYREISIRALRSLEFRAIPGTEGVTSLMWSPDGSSIAFFVGTSLKRVALGGGAPVSICDVPAGGGKSGSWGRRGDILFSSVQGDVIYRVPASGGAPTAVISARRDGEEDRVGWPWFLPDGDQFIYVAQSGIDHRVLKLASRGTAPRIVTAISSAVQLTERDLLVFARDGALLGQRVDWRSGRVIGGPFAIADSVRYFLSTGVAEFATSAGGTLVYQPGSDVSHLAWFDRSGRALQTIGAPGGYLDLTLSADRKRLLFTRSRPGISTFDIWSLDFERGVETPVTTERGSEFNPIWLPGGQSILYSAAETNLPQIFRRDLLSGKSERIHPSNGFQEAQGVTPDGNTLLYVERTERAEFAPWALRLDGHAPPTPLLPPGVHAEVARLSPDGRDVALISDESGRLEAYIVPFPGPGARVRVSSDGATTLWWSRDGRSLYFLSPGHGLMTAAISTSPALTVGRPVVLIPPQISDHWLGFDVSPDGQRFLAIVPQVNADRLPLTVVWNWPRGLEK